MSRKTGSLKGALAFFAFFTALAIVSSVLLLYTFRDRLILEYIRSQSPAKFGLSALAIESIKTHPIGRLSFEVKGLVLQTTPLAPVLRANRISISTPMTLLALYQAVHRGNDPTGLRTSTPIHIQLQGAHIALLGSTDKTESPTSTAPQTDVSHLTSTYVTPYVPLPLALQLDVSDTNVEMGSQEKPIHVKDLSGVLRANIDLDQTQATIETSAKIAFSVSMGSHFHLPIRTELTVKAQPKLQDISQLQVDVPDLSIQSLGLGVRGNGSLKLPEQNIAISLSGSTPDLSVLPMDEKDRNTLGLAERLSGSADITARLEGSLKSFIRAQGAFNLKNAIIPLALERETPIPVALKGPIKLHLGVPYSLRFDMANRQLLELNLPTADVSLDLTDAELRLPGKLFKPKNLAMTLVSRVTAADQTVAVSQFEFRLANFLARATGMLSLNPEQKSKIDVLATLPNLSGWPTLLPLLGSPDAASLVNTSTLNQAQGAFSFKGQIEAPLLKPEFISKDFRVSIENFNASGVRFPIGLKDYKGVVKGSVALNGDLSPTRWNFKQAKGMLDLGDLEIKFKDLFSKPAKRDLALAFSGSSDIPSSEPNKAQGKIESLEIRSQNSRLVLKGLVKKESNTRLSLNGELETQAKLEEIYDLLPALRDVRAKVSSGTATAKLRIDGSYDLEAGPAQSPLAFNGRVALRTPKILHLSDSQNKSHAPTPPPNQPSKAPEILSWPAVSNSQITFDLQANEVALPSETFKQVTLLAHLNKGSLAASSNIQQAFGGGLTLSSLTIAKLTTTPFENLTAQAKGSAKDLDLSLLAGFFDPKWKSLVGGIASGAFTLSLNPFAQDLLATTALDGALDIKKGFLSTVRFDQLVKAKLSEIPALNSLSQKKLEVATKGVHLGMSSTLSFKNQKLNLKQFKMTSPENNELELDGWIKTDFTTELSGKAHLADTPIGGSFRSANSDKQGRLVVPITVNGSLTSPNLSIAQKAIQEMTEKMVRYEASKATQKIRADLQQRANQEIEKQKKGAVDTLKEELKKRGLPF
ncbi:MAG: hypothetical protein RBT63_03995 [Bdellovibrionales bacterium]|jgi:hypothetical protein|nr:hypothetical protein [Bdellovibrionales bacterium]